MEARGDALPVVAQLLRVTLLLRRLMRVLPLFLLLMLLVLLPTAVPAGCRRAVSWYRGHAQNTRVADTIATGNVRLRMQRHDAHLAHIAVAVAHPHIPVFAQRGRSTGELQSGPCLANGYGGEELGYGMLLQCGSYRYKWGISISFEFKNILGTYPASAWPR